MLADELSWDRDSLSFEFLGMMAVGARQGECMYSTPVKWLKAQF